jgi:hypothetical protein
VAASPAPKIFRLANGVLIESLSLIVYLGLLENLLEV